LKLETLAIYVGLENQNETVGGGERTKNGRSGQVRSGQVKKEDKKLD
jgi:hypothetical protein